MKKNKMNKNQMPLIIKVMWKTRLKVCLICLKEHEDKESKELEMMA